VREASIFGENFMLKSKNITDKHKQIIRRLKRSFLKKYPDGLVGNAPVLDRPLVDIIKENTVSTHV